MDKNQVYCRYCGKLIDEDASFCTYCGKQQKANDDKKNKFDEDSTKAFGSNIKKALRTAVNTCKKIYPGHKNNKKRLLFRLLLSLEHFLSYYLLIGYIAFMSPLN